MSERKAPTTAVENSTKKKTVNFNLHPLALYRLFAIILFVFFTIPILWLALPLRPFNPLWRKLGVPNGKLPTDLIQRYWARLLVNLMGVTAKTEGSETIKEGALVMMYSHASFLDPLVVMGWSPVAVKFVFKRSLMFQLSYIFLLAALYGHIPINRTNLESAIKSLTKASKKIAKYNRSVAIAPEGTRSNNGQLQAFKKGPFHLVKGSNVPIAPVLIFNNFDLWPSGQIVTHCGEVVIRFLPIIHPTDADTVETLQEKVKEVMDAEFSKPPTLSKPKENLLPATIFYVVFSASVWFVYTCFL